MIHAILYCTDWVLVLGYGFLAVCLYPAAVWIARGMFRREPEPEKHHHHWNGRSACACGVPSPYRNNGYLPWEHGKL